MKKSIFLILLSVLLTAESCTAKSQRDTIICFETTQGKITIMLYPETSKHTENILKLVKSGFYNGVLFHRVIADFMIQTGDPNSKTAPSDIMLGAGDVGYTIPAEFIYPRYYHKRGALAAARQGDQTNPQKASSGCQFYIVQGKTFTEQELDMIENNKKKTLEAKLFQDVLKTKQAIIEKYQKEQNQQKLIKLRDAILAEVQTKLKTDSSYKFTKQQRSDYILLGGTPHLDGDYSVFGEVIEGIDVVEKISKVKTGMNNRPLEDVRILKAEVALK